MQEQGLKVSLLKSGSGNATKIETPKQKYQVDCGPLGKAITAQMEYIDRLLMWMPFRSPMDIEALTILKELGSGS